MKNTKINIVMIIVMVALTACSSGGGGNGSSSPAPEELPWPEFVPQSVRDLVEDRDFPMHWGDNPLDPSGEWILEGDITSGTYLPNGNSALYWELIFGANISLDNSSGEIIISVWTVRGSGNAFTIFGKVNDAVFLISGYWLEETAEVEVLQYDVVTGDWFEGCCMMMLVDGSGDDGDDGADDGGDGDDGDDGADDGDDGDDGSDDGDSGDECVYGYLMPLHPDSDDDGYGAEYVAQIYICDSVPDGYVTNGGDWDDHDETIHPGSEEICDEKDNNQDGDVDENCQPVMVGDAYVREDDPDANYGDSSVLKTSPVSGYYQIAYLKFFVPASDEPIDNATLQITSIAYPTPARGDLWVCGTNTNWMESSITYDNSPGGEWGCTKMEGLELDSTTIWIDVTDLLPVGGGEMAIKIYSYPYLKGGTITFYSSADDASRGPELTISTEVSPK